MLISWLTMQLKEFRRYYTKQTRHGIAVEC